MELGEGVTGWGYRTGCWAGAWGLHFKNLQVACNLQATNCTALL